MSLIASIIVYVWLGAYVVAFVICSVYCRIQKKKDRKRFDQKQAASVNKSETIQPDANNHQADRGIKPTLRKVKRQLEAYLYGLTRYMSIVVGKIPSNRIRRTLMKIVFCMDVSSDAVLYGGFEIRSPWNVKIGRAVIGVGALIDGRQPVTIENDVVLASGVSIYTMQHDVNDPWFRINDKGGPVTIHQHAWISSHTTILPKVEVGEGAVLSANAVATKSLDAFGIYSGVPATKKRERSHDLRYVSGQNYWHFY